ncbi:MAG: hypothetical protein KJO18_06770 [Acidimicrobiia bacterium]|nr:hypothetical protein [Acidimicrobiia bacterium]NNF44255.1 hypothetical protein [Phycisphaerales bacterium]
MAVRLGDLLIESGVLTTPQVDMILREQRDTGEPFGALAERLYAVDPAVVEAAWARQYATLTRTVNPELEEMDPNALALVTRRQAWQFRVLPIRFDPHELMMATVPQYLPRALRFAANIIGYPVFYVMCDPEALGRALCTHYPLPGFTAESIHDCGLDGMLRRARSNAA